MPSSFAAKCALAAERLIFCEAPVEAIRRAAMQKKAQEDQIRGPRWPIVAVVATLTLAAAAPSLWHGAHLSFINSGRDVGSMQFQFDRGEIKSNPTPAQIEAVARNVSFPVVLPAGLPQGTFPTMVMRTGQSALVLQYDLPGSWRRDDHLLLVVLADPKALGPSVHIRTKYALVMGNRRGGTHFMAGNEEVFVMRSSLRPEELNHLKNATIAAGKATR